jgi:hypothetical protein
MVKYPPRFFSPSILINVTIELFNRFPDGGERKIRKRMIAN